MGSYGDGDFGTRAPAWYRPFHHLYFCRMKVTDIREGKTREKILEEKGLKNKGERR